jgi:hypothetical protein
MPVYLNNPSAPATKKQLYRISLLTGEDYSGRKLNMKQASDLIEDLELEQIANESTNQSTVDFDPFSEAHVTIVQGEQKSGKTNYAVGKVKDSYYKDCIRIFCEKVLSIECEVKSYNNKERLAKIRKNGQIKYIKIPENYELASPMKIFSNIHLYGIPYAYVPSFRHLAKWLRIGLICNGWLIMDEAHVGMNARSGSTTLGKELVTECMQFAKSRLDVMLITHLPRLIDWVGRTIPTRSVMCSNYDKKHHIVNYKLRRKGDKRATEHSFDASQYWPNYNPNEKVIH